MKSTNCIKPKKLILNISDLSQPLWTSNYLSILRGYFGRSGPHKTQMIHPLKERDKKYIITQTNLKDRDDYS